MKRFRKEQKTESAEQILLIQWCKRKSYLYPMLNNIFAIPNGGLRNKITAARLKLEGVKKGVPDLFLAVPNEDYHGLFIEMKRIKGGTTSEDQIKWKHLLEEAGYCHRVAYGFEEAKRELKKYLYID